MTLVGLMGWKLDWKELRDEMLCEYIQEVFKKCNPLHETSARTWCSGKTWRERVGREVGGGIGMGKTCEPKAFSFQCMTKFTTKKKKKKEMQSMLIRS